MRQINLLIPPKEILITIFVDGTIEIEERMALSGDLWSPFDESMFEIIDDEGAARLRAYRAKKKEQQDVE